MIIKKTSMPSPFPTSNIVGAKRVSDTDVYNCNYVNDNKKIDVLYDQVVNSFGAQTLNINTSGYSFIIMFYKCYYQLSAVQSKILYTGINTQLNDNFFFNNNFYSGNREVTVNNTNIVFGDALNETKNVDNNWYVPIKILGVKL